MRLKTVSAVLRPRRSWEAVDMGFALLQRYLGPVYGAWFAVAIPVFILLNLVCSQALWLAPLILWWLKPLLDRIPLHVLGHALFGAPPSVVETLRALPGLLRREPVRALTLLRFDPARSFHLPIIQLEELRGKMRRQRIRVLATQNNSPAAWLTIVCLHFEAGLEVALFVLPWLLFPEFLQPDFSLLSAQQTPDGQQLLLNLASFCSLSLIEPFYVAGGFALYLNRRTWLEAWDLEIGFRRLAERLERLDRLERVKKAVAPGTALLLLFSLGLATPETAHPAPAPKPLAGSDCQALFERQARLQNAPSALKQTLARVYEEAPFQHCEIEAVWRWREAASAAEPKPRTSPAMGNFGQALAELLELALWLGFGLALAAVVWSLIKAFDTQRRKDKEPFSRAAPALVYGRRLRPAADPGAPAAAWRLWETGRTREALGLLYRASLAGIMARHGVDFGAAATEDECLRIAEKHSPDVELLGFFTRLTRVWQAAAYAHRPPDSQTMRQLCEQWPQCFTARQA